jgi:hypothetical protein
MMLLLLIAIVLVQDLWKSAYGYWLLLQLPVLLMSRQFIVVTRLPLLQIIPSLVLYSIFVVDNKKTYYLPSFDSMISVL